jgi:esterase/lipase superfamily enzyme
MGSALAMEALRQIEIKSPNWSKQNLGGVILMSPDLDVDVFRSQMNRFDEVPQPFLVFVSRKDTILNISQRIRGTHSRERLGNLSSLDAVSDLPIEIVDTTAFADEAESGHFVAATSPALLSLLNAARETADAFQRNRDAFVLNEFLPGPVVEDGAVTKISLIVHGAGNR